MSIDECPPILDSDTYLVKAIKNMAYMIKKRPTNQTLLESHKRLEEALKFYANKSSWDLDVVTSGDISRRVILYKDQYEVNEWTIYAGKKAIEALASIPVLVKELKCAPV